MKTPTSIVGSERRKCKALPERSWGANGTGFTLFELLVVMVLLSLLVAMAFPSVGRGMSTIRLQTASREVAAAIRLARSKACREQQVYYLSFDQEKNQIQLASQDSKYQKAFVLPEGISMKQVTLLPGLDDGQEQKVLYFSPNGMTEGFEILLRNDRGRELRIVQNFLTNAPRIEEPSREAAGY